MANVQDKLADTSIEDRAHQENLLVTMMSVTVKPILLVKATIGRST